MKLKKYHVDTSPLTPENQEKAMYFIEVNAYNHQFIPNTDGQYVCFWEENVKPSAFPALFGCVIEELP